MDGAFARRRVGVAVADLATGALRAAVAASFALAAGFALVAGFILAADVAAAFVFAEAARWAGAAGFATGFSLAVVLAAAAAARGTLVFGTRRLASSAFGLFAIRFDLPPIEAAEA